MSALHFFDTNILLYSISRAEDEAVKRERAVALLDKDGGALSVQVLQEFYVQATRVTRADALPHGIAAGLNSYVEPICGSGHHTFSSYADVGFKGCAWLLVLGQRHYRRH